MKMIQGVVLSSASLELDRQSIGEIVTLYTYIHLILLHSILRACRSEHVAIHLCAAVEYLIHLTANDAAA
jgi:hypothetical protein